MVPLTSRKNQPKINLGCLLALLLLFLCIFYVVALFTAFYPYTRPYAIWGLGTVFIGPALFCFPLFRKRWSSGTLIYAALAAVVLAGIHTYQENPTTKGRIVRVAEYGGGEHVFRGQEILDQIKRQQELMVLSLLTDYEGIETLVFTDISEDPHHEVMPGGPQFYVKGLINGRYPVYFGTDLHDSLQRVDNWEDVETYPGIVKRAPDGGWVQVQPSDLDLPENQELINSIEVTYYTKDDIYKDR